MVDGAGMIDQDSAGALLTIESEAGATVALVGDRAQRLAPNTSATVMIDPETDRGREVPVTVVLRPNDPINADDDVVIRAGGGNVDALVDKALDTAEEYQQFVEQSLIRSPYAISVNVPRRGVASLDDLLGDVPFKRYKPYLEASASALMDLRWVEIVATTPVLEDGAILSRVDLTHYDVLVEASSVEELADRIAIVRNLFDKHQNPHHENTKSERKE